MITLQGEAKYSKEKNKLKWKNKVNLKSSVELLNMEDI